MPRHFPGENNPSQGALEQDCGCGTGTGGIMINIAMKSQGAIDNRSLSSINTISYDVVQAQTIHSLNTRKQGNSVQSPPGTTTSAAAPSRNAPASAQSQPPSAAAHPRQAPASAMPQSASASTRRPIPPLRHMVQKGQKISLESRLPLHTLKACLGWNTTNTQCDVDVSAFLLDSTGKVPGDDWFIFYGQTESPDRSTIFCPEQSVDRESITVSLGKLNPAVKKIVFVLTIHEALEKNLNFGMVQDAYIRILNADSKEELASFRMEEYYSNVISMMIGEVYQHNNTWKFNAIGNGVAKDLSGLCELYGVQVSD